MTFALVLVPVLGLFGAVHGYLWCRLVRDTTTPGSRPRRAGTAAAVALPLTGLAAVLSGPSGAPFAVQQALAWPGYLWLALVLYLTLALLAGEAVRLVWLRWAGRRDARQDQPPQPTESAAGPSSAASSTTSSTTPSAASAASAAGDREPAPTLLPPGAHALPPPAHPPRRLFVARAVAAGATLAAAATVGYGTTTTLRGPRVVRVTVPLAKLPRAAHRFRIAVVSDIHLGPILGRAHTRRIVETINRTGPDLVAIVGDLVDGSVTDLGPAAEPLRDLRSRHGAYFVTGNHEYYSGAAQWVDHVRELGITPLENARTELPAFDLAGINDLAGEREGTGPDYARALDGRDPARAVVLMAHQPVTIHETVRHGVDLQLSGHTHGGQMWPVTYLAAATNPTLAGLERYGDTQLYVTRGAGTWGPPVRVGAPPDITVVELASLRA
ncbi:metallophosphoesterase [Streptomyces piniterrae]|uniref:Metallophosphoesterase n=1 Tax=Streptomyces piniterrae TaxID=2571125 RepID=A0A4U0NFY8_9ACTN|nr:metallophosphoesterase [Streptomyces piniterrae]TJZ53047.1 metallophosphoesterase [Streptomyces piniterrae]